MMAESSTKTEEKIDTLVVQYLELFNKFQNSSNDNKREINSQIKIIEEKLYKQFELFSNWLWKKKFSYIKDWQTKEEAFWFSVAKCLNDWKKDNSIKSFAAYFAVVLKHKVDEYYKEDNNQFTYVSGKICTIVKVLMKSAEKRPILLKDRSKTKEFVIDILGYTEEDYIAVLKYLQAKNFLSLSIDEENDDASKRIIEIEDDSQITEQNVSSILSFKSILDKINILYQKQDDKEFLSKVITFKLLSLVEPKDIELIRFYKFIDVQLLSGFLNGEFPNQKEIERSSGSVNKKWNQFVAKLLKSYGTELQEALDLS